MAASVAIGQLQLTNAHGYQSITLYNLIGQGNGGCDGALYRVCNGIAIRSWTLTLSYSNPGNSSPTSAPPGSTLTFTGGSSDVIGPYSGSGDGYNGSRAGAWEIPLAGVGGFEPPCPPCDYQLTRIEFSGAIDSAGLPLSVGAPGNASQFGASPNFDAVWLVQSNDPSQPGYVDYGNPGFFGGLYDVVVTDQSSGPAAAELAISLTHTGRFVQGQSGGVYAIAVSNGASGGPTNGAVTVTDTAPSGMTVTSMSGTGWTCTALPVCARTDALPPGAAYPPITVEVSLAPDAGSPVVNQASVSGGGSAGASVTDSTAIVSDSAVLTLAKSHSGNFAQGQNGAAYIISVSNTGARGTVGTVVVSETTPAGLTLASMSGDGWNCTSLPSCSRADSLAAGASYPSIIATVNVAANAPTPLANQASVSGGGSRTATASDSTVIIAASSNAITAGSAAAAPGGVFSIPVTLQLAAGAAADVATFGMQITPVGDAPPLAAMSSLIFTKDSWIPNQPFANTGGTSSALGVVWSSLGITASGTQILGVVTGTAPPNAAIGQTYSVSITGADAGLNGADVPVRAGPNGTLTIATIYLVGDVDPHASDAAPNFGNGRLDIYDLIQVLFAVDNVPGFSPAPCSDRFDAMDLYPVDTPAVRGGNGRVDIYDLIQELFRVNALDSARPVRASLGGSCSASQSIANAAGAGSRDSALRRAVIDGSLVFGAPAKVREGVESVPIYLEAARALTRIALTFGLGDQRSSLKFLPAAVAPSLASDGQHGVIAAAWTQGLSVPAGARMLLGYVEGPAGASAEWTVFGVSAASLEGEREVRIGAPGGTVK